VDNAVGFDDDSLASGCGSDLIADLHQRAEYIIRPVIARCNRNF